MREIRFLCLAVSRRDGGNCIAGIDLDTGKWVRPINSGRTEAFSDGELCVLDNVTGKRRFLALLDVLQLRLEEFAGINAQPENWKIVPASYENPWRVMERHNEISHAKQLNSYVDGADRLLHSYEDSIRESDVKLHSLSHSLSLVCPNELCWKITDGRYPGKLQVRAEFRFEQIPYSLVVTDPDWEAKVGKCGVGRYPHSKISGLYSNNVFLTISLAAIPLHGYHYKLVAGVVLLPATK